MYFLIAKFIILCYYYGPMNNNSISVRMPVAYADHVGHQHSLVWVRFSIPSDIAAIIPHNSNSLLSAIQSAAVILRCSNPIPANTRVLALLRIVDAQTLEQLPVAAVGAAMLSSRRIVGGHYFYSTLSFPVQVPNVAVDTPTRISLTLFLMRRNASGFDVPVASRPHIWTSSPFSHAHEEHPALQ